MWVGVVLITLMAFFPPWVGSESPPSAGDAQFIGWNFALGQPKYRSNRPQSSKTYATGPDGQKVLTSERTHYPRITYLNSRIDYGRFLLQVVPVLLITVGAILTVRKEELNVETQKE